tara:strand:+ start:222 stop:416 length:195 start_codon:yes stop_codon:yes gene_type:complete
MKIYLDSIFKNINPTILNKYNIKELSSNDIGNCYEIEFEGNKKDLRKFYNKFFNTGESFDNYIK